MSRKIKTTRTSAQTRQVNPLEEQMFDDIRAGKKIGEDISLERALLIASGIDDEEEIFAYRSKIRGIYKRFMSRLISEEKEMRGDFNDVDKAMLLNIVINKPKNGKTKEKKGTELYSESRISLVDAVDAYYAKSREKGANCVGLTSLFTVLCSYASIPVSILVSGQHIKNIVLVDTPFGKKKQVIENTSNVGTEYNAETNDYKDYVEYNAASLIAVVYSQKASDCISEGDIRAAAKYLDIALKIEPDLFCAHYSLGLIDAAQDSSKVTSSTKRRWRNAIRHFTKAVWLNPRLYEGYTQRAGVKIDLEDLDCALEDYKRARRIAPERIDAHVGIAYIEMLKENPKAARRSLRCAAKINPTNPDIHYIDGVLKYEKGDYAEAAKAYMFALARDPEHDGALLELKRLKKEGHIPDSLQTR